MTSKICKVCQLTKPIEEFYKDKKMKDGYYNKCKLCTCKQNNLRYENNKEQRQLQMKEYNKTNRIKLAEYERNRRTIDPQFRLIKNLRCRLYQALKGNSKSSKTKDLIGMGFDDFIKWIKFQLPIGYTLDDVGSKIHIDHILPLSSFNLLNEDELHKAMSYSNLQPLLASDNLHKSNKVDLNLYNKKQVEAAVFKQNLVDNFNLL